MLEKNTPSCFKAFFEEVDTTASDARLIITSHDFKRKSASLTLARAHAGALVISAYETALGAHALQELASKTGLARIDDACIRILEQYSAAHSPTLVVQLLEKLSLAAGTGEALTQDLLISCLPDANSENTHEYTEVLFSGSSKRLLEALDAARASAGEPQFVASLARLCLDAKRLQNGHSHGRARPLFWKTEKIVKSAQQRLDRFPQRLEVALSEISKAETTLRSSAPLANLIAERLCLRLARCFAPSRGRT